MSSAGCPTAARTGREKHRGHREAKGKHRKTEKGIRRLHAQGNPAKLRSAHHGCLSALPRQDLAKMAEALVALTAFLMRMTADQEETVAEPPKRVIKDWLSHPEIAQYIQIKSFTPAGDELLLSAHDAHYVKGIFTGETPNGFGNKSREIADSLRYTVGSFVAANQHVLETTSTSTFQVAVSPHEVFTMQSMTAVMDSAHSTV